MTEKKLTVMLTVFFLLSLCALDQVSAAPLFPTYRDIPILSTEFYGTVSAQTSENDPLPVGTVIEAFAYNQSCGIFSISAAGYYGLLTCRADTISTSEIEGSYQGQNILFEINGYPAVTSGDTVWYSGEFHQVDLNPTIRCGNNWCEVTEDCRTCAEDCGLCPSTTGGGTTGGAGGTGGASGGGGSASGGGGGGSSSSSSSSSTGRTGDYLAGNLSQNISFPVCVENWLCTNWEPEICPISEIQTRNCIDLTNCTTNYTKPYLNQTCQYLGTCYDYLINQDETDSDCGGQKCDPCDLDKMCRKNTDCKSGFCHPYEEVCKEPTCNDEVQNQGEEGVDCGGPCPACIGGILPVLERPGEIIGIIAVGCGPFPFAFLLITIIMLFVIYLIGQFFVEQYRETRAFKKLSKLAQIKRIYTLKRNLNIFLFSGLLITLTIALYLYYLCKLIVWLLLLFLFLLPLIIATVLKFLVYDEERKKKKMNELLSTHENQLKKILAIENKEIADLIDQIHDELAELSKNDKIDAKIKAKLSEMLEVIESFEKTVPINPLMEKKLCNIIEDLEDEKENMKEDPDMKRAFDIFLLIKKIHDAKEYHIEEIKKDIAAADEIGSIDDDNEENDDDRPIPLRKKDPASSEETHPRQEEREENGTNESLSPANPNEKNDESEPEVLDDDDAEEMEKIEELKKNEKKKPPIGPAASEEPAKNKIEETENIEEKAEQKNETEKQGAKTTGIGTESKVIDAPKIIAPDSRYYLNTNQAFILKDGRAVHSLKELLSVLKNMSESEFYFFDNEFKNDFANWIKDIFHFDEVYQAMVNIKKRREMVQVLEKFIV
ncbi:MAG: hypothetical protein KKF44_04520 [Nanoarchaeota archaeon]|nr:hypothetical protein [Nanoarchaeota archaeon]